MRDTTKADLAAANREIREVMDQNSSLKKEAEAAYRKGYSTAAKMFAGVAMASQSQAAIIAHLTNALANLTQPE